MICELAKYLPLCGVGPELVQMTVGLQIMEIHQVCRPVVVTCGCAAGRERPQKKAFPDGESNPGRGGESAES